MPPSPFPFSSYSCGLTLRRAIPLLSFSSLTNGQVLNPVVYQWQYLTKVTLPALALSVYSTISQSKAIQEKSHNFAKVIRRCKVLAQTFWHFVNNEWFYDSSNALACHALLTPADQKSFCIDAREIKWFEYFNNFSYGLQRCVLQRSQRSGFGGPAIASSEAGIDSHRFSNSSSLSLTHFHSLSPPCPPGGLSIRHLCTSTNVLNLLPPPRCPRSPPASSHLTIDRFVLHDDVVPKRTLTDAMVKAKGKGAWLLPDLAFALSYRLGHKSHRLVVYIYTLRFHVHDRLLQ